MPGQVALSFMYLTYAVVGALFLVAVSAALIRLFVASLRRGAASAKPRGREVVWTLVPVLVVVGLTVLGEIPRGWVKFAPGPRAAENERRLIH